MKCFLYIKKEHRPINMSNLKTLLVNRDKNHALKYGNNNKNHVNLF